MHRQGETLLSSLTWLTRGLLVLVGVSVWSVEQACAIVPVAASLAAADGERDPFRALTFRFTPPGEQWQQRGSGLFWELEVTEFEGEHDVFAGEDDVAPGDDLAVHRREMSSWVVPIAAPLFRRERLPHRRESLIVSRVPRGPPRVIG